MNAPARIRVLVVDSQEMVAESLVRLLSDDPAITVIGAAPTGGAGIATALAKKPDVVVMDFRLPDMDGAAATRALLAQQDDIKVILLSGSDRPGAYHAAREAGCASWVSKTSAVRDLVNTVHLVHEGDEVAFPELEDLPSLDRLVVHYQPVVALADQRIVGLEALVRWEHPTRGLVSPADFMPAAEQTGFVLDLGRSVAKSALRQLATWQSEMPADPPLWMGVNLAASSIADPTLVTWVLETLESAGVDPSCLVLEVTEAVLVTEAETAARLRTLREAGVRIALDDFGTAFSSLAYLRQFPFDVIKIDTSFTAELPHARRSTLLLESIGHIVDMFGVTGIAEGVERADQADCLVGAGWLYGQGYLYSPPVEAAAIPPLLMRARR